jgi:hypothetical protein
LIRLLIAKNEHDSFCIFVFSEKSASISIPASESSMKTFDEQIADIERLDDFRRQARRLRQEAIKALTAIAYVPRPRTGTFNEAAATRPGWEPPGDDVEKAEVLHALARAKADDKDGDDLAQQSRDNIIRDLESIKLKDLESSQGSSATSEPLDHVPIFRSALILQALAETPGQAFSDAALFCFYRIVQELNVVTAPNWASGAARADEGSQVTAFVTGECARALLALEATLRQTADAAELLGEEAARQALSKAIENKEIKKWREDEEEFRKYSLSVSLRALPNFIISPPDPADPLAEEAKQRLDRIVDALETISDKTRSLKLPRGALPKSGSKDRMQTIQSNYSAEIAKGIAWSAVD